MRILGLGTLAVAIAGALAWSSGYRTQGALARSGPPPAPRAMTVPPTVIGMNMGVPSYWSGEVVYANIVKNTGDFSGNGQEKHGALLGPDGFPLNSPKGHVFGTFLDIKNILAGNFNCEVSPGWTASSQFAGTISGNHDRFRLTIPKNNRYPVALRFTADRDGLSMSKFSCQMADAAGAKLNPAFVDDMKAFRILRFMDWMGANTGASRTWATRRKPSDLSLVWGASVEDMVDLANEMHADPWFTLPWGGDEEYYRNFAIYVRDHLAPGRKAYVELANEVWNPSFDQSKDAAKKGEAKYPGVGSQKATDYYYGDRVREMMAIWSQVFAGQMSRIVRVAGTQAAWVERADDVLGHGDTWRSVDALAIAPYFGGNIQDISEEGKARIDKVFARLPEQAEGAIHRAEQTKAIAYKYGLRQVAYEGGLEVSAYNPQAGADARAIIHDPRVYEVYTEFLRKWQTRVGDAFVLYDSTGASSFSHKDFTGQPLADAPKMRAVTDFSNGLPKQP